MRWRWGRDEVEVGKGEGSQSTLPPLGSGTVAVTGDSQAEIPESGSLCLEHHTLLLGI